MHSIPYRTSQKVSVLSVLESSVNSLVLSWSIKKIKKTDFNDFVTPRTHLVPSANMQGGGDLPPPDSDINVGDMRESIDKNSQVALVMTSMSLPLSIDKLRGLVDVAYDFSYHSIIYMEFFFSNLYAWVKKFIRRNFSNISRSIILKYYNISPEYLITILILQSGGLHKIYIYSWVSY